MKKDMLHSIAVKCVGSLNRRVKKEGTDIQKMVLGVEILLHNIPKLILTVLIAALLGILPLTLITWLSFACIRRYASGLHASNNIACTITTLLMFVAIPYIVQGTHINILVLFTVFGLVGIGLYNYAPADTKARPILGKAKRARLRKKSVIACACLLAFALVLRNQAFYVLFSIGAVYALVAVLPATYTILGRSKKNYEQYE